MFKHVAVQYCRGQVRVADSSIEAGTEAVATVETNFVTAQEARGFGKHWLANQERKT